MAVLVLTSVLAIAPLGLSEMQAPTLSAQPAINGQVDEAEWGVAQSFTFNSPRAGTSTVRLGYFAETGQLAMGVVLQDATLKDSGTAAEKDKVEIFIAPRIPTDPTDFKDIKLVVYPDGSWEYSRGNGSGFPSFPESSGTNPATTTATDWIFAVTKSAASWEVELLVKIGTFKAGDRIALAVRQTDIDTALASKTSVRPTGFDQAKPTKWETTVLTGRPSPVQFSVVPAAMEAAVGGDVIVTLPAGSTGGRLTAQVKGPGDSGFIPIGTLQNGAAGPNRFYWAPLKPGAWQVQAIWTGDGNFGAVTTAPATINVAKPSPIGATVLDTGTLRVAFPPENAGAPAEWSYINTKAWATDAGGKTITLSQLDKSNSCRAAPEPWVGMANMGDGPLIIRLDPPVLRAALALSSPRDTFDANIKAFTSRGTLKTEVNGAGGCNTPLFASLGDVEDDVARIEVTYSGKDPREVLEVFFAHPLQSTAPQVTVWPEVAPLHPDGIGRLHVSAGSPHRLTRTDVTVTSGTRTLASETCDAAPAQVWIDCPVDVMVPIGARDVRVQVVSKDQLDRSWTRTKTVTVDDDETPPAVSLLPRPLLAPPGAAVAVTARGIDGSGIRSITMQAVDEKGDLLNEKSCAPEDEPRVAECVMGVTPPATGIAYVTATIEDDSGNTATAGPKPLPVRGADADGDGLPDALELKIGTNPNRGDTDGDGLSDGWEVVGVDRNGDGTAELDLASMGADPQVQDLFVEMDWAEHDGHSHAVDYGAIQLVRNVLSARGIRLHVDISQGGGPYDPVRFDHGHAAHRKLIAPERAGIFMHVLSGHMGGPAAGGGWTIYLPAAPARDQSSGIVGAQLLHEIGHHLELGHGGAGTTTDTKTNAQVPAAYSEDYKPNYLSVMNNAYAWGLYVDTVDGLLRVPSYAGLTVGDLDEKALDEPAGLSFGLEPFRQSLRAGPTLVLQDQSVTGVRVRYTCPGDGPVRWAFAPGPIDWNCNGASEDTGVTADINRGGLNAGTGALVSRTDWGALSFRGSDCPQYGMMLEDALDMPAGTGDHGLAYELLGLSPCPLHAPATTPLDSTGKSVAVAEAPPGKIEDADGRDNDGDGNADEGFADDDGDSVVNLIDDCPRTKDSAQTDRDRDGRGDVCQAPPGGVEDLKVVDDIENATLLLTWSPVSGVWGYNVYRVEGGLVSRLGGSYPSTLYPLFEDVAGSAAATYIVRAVNDQGDQGPAATGTPIMDDADGDGGDGGADGRGVPGVSPLVTLALVGLGAVVLRRRRG